MKKYLLSAAFIFFIYFSQAQEKEKAFQIGLGIVPGTVLGSGGTIFSLGACLQGEYRFASHFSAFASVGYTNMFATGKETGHLDLIPMQIGPRAYLTSKFFVGAGLGYTILSEEGDKTEAFNYRPHIGIDGKKWQATMGYNAISKYGANLQSIDFTFVLKF
jgi:hypothetical protein